MLEIPLSKCRLEAPELLWKLEFFQGEELIKTSALRQ